MYNSNSTMVDSDVIEVIAFDADDTLWSNEPFFQEIERKFEVLLGSYGTPAHISAELYKTEMENLERYGYGAKGFTLSMMETALRVSRGQVSSQVIEQILLLGKSLLDMPIELFPGAEYTLKELNGYQLIVVTKGDMLDQERKLARSGLDPYFDSIEIMSEKSEEEYKDLLYALSINPNQFLMVGNSFKSDIQPVLNIGGAAIHIPAKVTWKHEVVEEFTHPHLRTIDSIVHVHRALYSFNILE